MWMWWPKFWQNYLLDQQSNCIIVVRSWNAFVIWENVVITLLRWTTSQPLSSGYNRAGLLGLMKSRLSQTGEASGVGKPVTRLATLASSPVRPNSSSLLASAPACTIQFCSSYLSSIVAWKVFFKLVRFGFFSVGFKLVFLSWVHCREGRPGLLEEQQESGCSNDEFQTKFPSLPLCPRHHSLQLQHGRHRLPRPHPRQHEPQREEDGVRGAGATRHPGNRSRKGEHTTRSV